MKIENSKILLTGGASGLGRYFATELKKQGALVAILDINADHIALLETENAEIHTLQCDVSDYDEVESNINKLEGDWGIPEILINNAALIYSRPMYNPVDKTQRKHPIKEWQNVIDVNLTGTFNVTTHWIEKIISHRKNGLIINMSSICANGNAGQSAYSASKAGIEALTKTWAKELGSRGIRSVAIAPGYTDTSGTHKNVHEHHIKHIIKNTPLSCLGNKKEIYSTVEYAITNEFINGTTIPINGGLII